MSEKILGVTSKRWVEKFLLDCANLPSDIYEESDKRALRVLSKYPEVFAEIEFPRVSAGIKLPPGHGLVAVAHSLRQIWDAPNLWHRNWYIYKLHDFHHGAVAESKHARKWGGYSEAFLSSFDAVIAETQEPPAIDAFTAALIYLQKTDKARHCPNLTCPAPYFFATKKGQKHCSEKCAAEATREAKRRWWADNRSKNGGIE